MTGDDRCVDLEDPSVKQALEWRGLDHVLDDLDERGTSQRSGPRDGRLGLELGHEMFGEDLRDRGFFEHVGRDVGKALRAREGAPAPK